MAIRRNFGGATIRKPGAYSVSQTSPDASTTTVSTDTILVIGEADAGEGGASEGIQSFSSSGFNRLQAKYRTGPLVDCAKVALAPSRTPGIGGAGRILVWKTNPSTQASLALASSYDTIKALEYGVGGNRITYANTLSAEGEASVTGSAAVTNFAGLNTLTLDIRSNGGAAETVTFAAPANISDVISQIDAQTTDLTASESSGVLTISRDAATNGHQNGWGQTIEVVGGTALGDLFLTAGQFGTATEIQASATVTQPRDSITETTVMGGTIAMSAGRDDSGSVTAATIEVTSTSVELVETGGSSYSFAKTDFPLMKDMVAAIDALSGWSATVPATIKNLSVNIMDEVSPIGAFSPAGNSPARIKRDAQDYQDMLEASILIEGSSPAPETGLPDAEATQNLAGGTKGSSSSSSFSAGLDAALAEEVNAIVICASQDAADDITAGLTDSGSTYDIETLHAALDTHLRLRGSIKNRKEAQGYVGYRKASREEAYEQSATLGSELVQMHMQDILVVDSSNELTWKQPHVLAAMTAGARLGSTVGEPLTHKFYAVSGAGHFVNTSTGVSAGDFDPLIDFDDAIEAGMTFLEPAAGSFRLTVDNTTYGADENFVFNRGSVVEASQFAAKTVRSDAETAFVGRKNADVDATAIKSRVRTKLIELFEDKVLSASSDAPQGFKDDETFIVEVTGNTAEVRVEIKPVQGLEFILITFTLGETTQSA